MGLNFHPKPGTVLICDYSTGFVEPEMVKRRLAVVITPRLRRRDGLCSVIPLSETPPESIELYHHQITLDRPLPQPWGGVNRWAKCDMFATVSYDRLMPIGIGKDKITGLRKYIYPILSDSDLKAVQVAVLHSLNMGTLTKHL